MEIRGCGHVIALARSSHTARRSDSIREAELWLFIAPTVGLHLYIDITLGVALNLGRPTLSLVY